MKAGKWQGAMVGWLCVLAACPAMALNVATPYVSADFMWGQGYTGSNVEIGIIDLYLADGTHPAISGNYLGGEKFSKGASFIGSHATEVAGTAASQNATYRGVAPGAGWWTGQTANPGQNSSQRIQTVAAESFAQGLGGLNGNGVEVITLSIGLGGVADGSDQWSLGLDHIVQTNGRVVTVAAGNSGPGRGTLDGLPTGAFNVITVGATGDTGGSPSKDYSRLASYSSRGPSPDGRAKPDIVAPGSVMHLPTLSGGWADVSGTSFATPMVAGGAALLTGMGRDLGYATDPEVIKAVLLNSADKLTGWTHTPTQPLDLDQGAGQMDLRKAYSQYAPGEFAPGQAPPVGWDKGQVYWNARNLYAIDGRLAAGEFMDLTLTWDRIVTTDTENIDRVIYAPDRLDDLNLYLYAAGNLTSPVARSVSAVDNVEHIHFPVPSEGRYVIGVEMSGAVAGDSGSYALAWNAVRAPLIRGDFNDDGAVNATDVDLLWNVLGSAVPPAPALYDLTGDGLINIGDATELIRGILHTSMADTDLDGEVGIVDLGALANAYDGPGRFRDGDTDGNGLVDILDLGNLANDYDKTFPASGG